MLLAIAAIAAIALMATACSSTSDATPAASGEPSVPTSDPTRAATPIPTPSPSPEPALQAPLPLDTEVFETLNPRPELRALDRSIDPGFDEREALPKDWINPVYTPKFATPEEVEDVMIEDELVMGLNVGGDVRAYPIGIMRVREMVNDEVGGIPLLVTW